MNAKPHRLGEVQSMRARSLPVRVAAAGLALTAGLSSAAAPAEAVQTLPAQPSMFVPGRPPALLAVGRGRTADGIASLTRPSAAHPDRIALFRPHDGTWLLPEADSAIHTIMCGEPGDEPIPADYEGTGYAQIALFRRAAGQWLLRSGTGKIVTIPFGGGEDIPVPGDYRGQGQAQLAVFRPSIGSWFFWHEGGTKSVVSFGAAGDEAVPADYLGTGALQMAVYRPSAGLWLVRTPDARSLPLTWGRPGDHPVPADYDGVGHAEVAVYRPATGQWIIHQGNGTGRTVLFGGPGDEAVPGDYLGLGCAQMAIYRPTTGQWFVRAPGGETLGIAFGGPGDRPVPVRFAPSFGAWQHRHSGIREASERVIRTAEEWQQLWYGLHAASTVPAPAPEIDFARSMLLAVFMGECPTSGYAVSIEAVAEVDGELQVRVHERTPAEGAISAQVLTQPCYLLLVRKSELPARFLREPGRTSPEKGPPALW
jgi:hypothetical protein